MLETKGTHAHPSQTCAPVWAPSAHEWSLQGGGPRSREPAGLHPWEPHTALLSACRGPFPQGSVPVYETWTAPTGDGRRGSIPHAGDRHQGERKTSVITELMAQGCRGAAGEQRRMAMYPPSGHTQAWLCRQPGATHTNTQQHPQCTYSGFEYHPSCKWNQCFLDKWPFLGLGQKIGCL